jgi:hypothetical protein
MSLFLRTYNKTLRATNNPVQMKRGPAIQKRFKGLLGVCSDLNTMKVSPEPQIKRKKASDK